MRLSPSLREKKRYILYELAPLKKEEINIEEVIKAVWAKSYEYGGYSFIAKSNLSVIKDIKKPLKENQFVLMCSPKYVEEVRYVLTNVDKISEIKVVPKIVKVSGTLKSLLEKR